MNSYADFLRSQGVGQTSFDPNAQIPQAAAASPLAALLRGATAANAGGGLSNPLRGQPQGQFTAAGAGPALQQGAQATMGAAAPGNALGSAASMGFGGPIGAAAMLQSGDPTKDMGTSLKLGALGGANIGLGYASLPDSIKNIFNIF